MKRVIWAVALSLGVSACGGGLGDLAEGGIGGTGFTIGPISAFGSIYVNGVKYSTDTAQVRMNGELATPDELRLGMVVTLESAQNSDGVTGIAQNISFSDDLRGPVESLDSPLGILRVAGQTVRVDERTVFEGSDGIAELALGDPLYISGLESGDGEFLATRIQRIHGPADTARVRGRVSALDRAALIFRLGRLYVDYHAVTLLPVLPENGQWLEAIGRLENNVLYAERLTSAEPQQAPANTLLGLRGHITRYTNEHDFDLAFRPATIVPETHFVFGGPLDLRLGAELTAHGKVDAHGVLILEQVEFNGAASGRGAPGRLLVSAPLEAVDPAQRRLRLLGISVDVPPGAMFADPRKPLARFGLIDLLPGERLAVHGFLNLTNQVFIAERVQREAPNPRVSLQAQAVEVEGASLTFKMLGVTVTSDARTRYFDARDHRPPLPAPGQPLQPLAGGEISATEFFVQAADRLVSASGQTLGAHLIAEHLVLLPDRIRP